MTVCQAALSGLHPHEEIAALDENELLAAIDTISAGAGLKIDCMTYKDFDLRGVQASGPADVESLKQVIGHIFNLSRRRRRRGNEETQPSEEISYTTRARALSVEIKDYMAQRMACRKSDHTIEKSQRALDLLFAVCGDINASSISTTHIRRVWDLIRWTPSGRASAKILATKRAEDLIAEGQALSLEAPARGTFELHRRMLNTFFNNLTETGTLHFSPMAAFPKIQDDLIEYPEKAERLFSEHDLQQIFDPVDFPENARKSPHLWWCPMIGLYTGMRVGEVAQLKLIDIVQEQGFWCFDIKITVDDDLRNSPGRKSRQRLKGRSAIRTFPIPQQLIDLGFLEFVEDVREAGRLRLFPNLSAGTFIGGETKANYGECLSRQLTSYFEELGFAKGVRFHAFRHTIISDFIQQGVDDRDIALLMGHANASEKAKSMSRQHYDHPASPKLRPKKSGLRQWQSEILSSFDPVVQLPRYEKGQFRHCLKRDALVHP